jgi:hypothetical protein
LLSKGSLPGKAMRYMTVTVSPGAAPSGCVPGVVVHPVVNTHAAMAMTATRRSHPPSGIVPLSLTGCFMERICVAARQ